MNLTSIIGYSGAIISSVSFLPQVLRIWKTKSAGDLSMVSLVLLATNAGLWCTYGLIESARPLWITNALTLTMVLAMAILKFRYRKNE